MDRREALGLTATAVLGALAGCASVANGVAGRGSNASETSGTANGTGDYTGTNATGDPNASAGNSNGGTNATGDSNASAGNASAAGAGDEYPIRDASPVVANAPLPPDAGSRRYATMGHGNANVTATLYGSWKCSHTHEFVLTDFHEVIKNYVEPGTLDVAFRAIAYANGGPYLGPDDPRAAHAGLSVWNHATANYWRYFSTVFRSQPQERFAWASESQLLRLAAAAGIADRGPLRRDIGRGAYDGAVRANGAAAAKAGVSTVPRLVVDGTVTAPTVDFQHTVSVIERKIRNA